MRLACAYCWLASLAAACLVGAANLHGFDAKKDKKPDEKKKADPKKKPEPILTKSSELKADDDKDIVFKKSPSKVFSVTLSADKRYQIDLSSKVFDAYLRLVDFKGNEVAFNDDVDPSTFDSRIVYEARETGDYKIVVTSRDGRLGKFTIKAIEVDVKTPLITGSRFVGKAIALKLVGGKTIYKGELNEMDATVHRRPYKVFTVELDKDKAYRIEARAEDPATLGAYLVLESAQKSQLRAQAFTSKAGHPRIEFSATQGETFRVVVTTLREAERGVFTLEIGPAPSNEKQP